MRLRRRHLPDDVESMGKELMHEAEAGKERMARMADVSGDDMAQRAELMREQWAENMSLERVTGFAGWTLMSTGLAWGVTDWMKGQRTWGSLVFPIALIAMGTAVLAGGGIWHRRSLNIEEAESMVREQIRSLDPFARLRVLRDVADDAVPFVRRMATRN